MKRNFLFIFFALIILMAENQFSTAQEQAETFKVPVGNMVIKAPEQFPTTKEPVFFTHSSHLRFSCVDCHHTWDRTGPITGCTASGCHERLMPDPPGAKPSQEKKVMSITGAYHKACRSCHRDILKDTGSPKYTGPIECDGCHNENYKDQDYTVEYMELPMGTLTINPPDDVDAKRASVNFSHNLHFTQECQTCHHDWDGEEEIAGCMTSGCHEDTEPYDGNRNINNPDNTLYYLTAYHKVCYHCHRDQNKAGQDVPIKCNECHNDE